MASADPGWPHLVDFLSVAGVKDGPLEGTLDLLAAEDVTDLDTLRHCFSVLAPRLKIGTRAKIGDALKSTAPVSLPQNSQAEQPPLPLPPVAFNVNIAFKKQEVTVRFALPGEDYAGKPVKALLPQLELLAAQQLSGAYKIIGIRMDGAMLALEKTLRDQGVPLGGVLSAAVTEMSLVHALAAGKAKAAPPKPAVPKPAPPMPKRKPDGKFMAGSAATFTGQKPGPKADAPKVDKRTKPPLWTVGGAIMIGDADAGARMDAMAAKVEAKGGVPAAGDGAGHGIWCVSCSKLQPLAKAFDLFPWNKHVTSDKHKGAARLRGALKPASTKEPKAHGSTGWLAEQQAQWRELRAVRVARRRNVGE